MGGRRWGHRPKSGSFTRATFAFQSPPHSTYAALHKPQKIRNAYENNAHGKIGLLVMILIYNSFLIATKNNADCANAMHMN